MKRILSLVLAFIICFSCLPLISSAKDDIPFEDIPNNAWYEDDLEYVYSLGLINGKNNPNTFLPDDNMTYAEVIKLAACMHQLYTTKEITLTNAPDIWYNSYVDYCKKENIIQKDYPYSEYATRAGYMEIFANALPTNALAPKNYLPEGFVADVSPSDEYSNSVYTLYRAGIVGGVDKNHNCAPDTNIKRCEVVTILSRMMDKSKRIKIGESATDVKWDFGGKTLRILCHNDGGEFLPKDSTVNKGDVIVDAISKRNEEVCKELNIKLEPVVVNGLTELESFAQKTILAAQDEFDLIYSHGLTLGEMVTKNMFVNWYDVPYVDFSKPWWAKSNADDLTYNGVCLVAVSDLNLSSITSSAVIAFNKNLAEKNGWDNLYETVLSGNWTFDEMYKLIKEGWTDADKSGDRSAGDTFAAAFPVDSTCNAWLWASGNRTIMKDIDDIPQISINTPSMSELIYKLNDLYYNTSGVASNNIDGFNATKLFNSGNAAMITVRLDDIISGKVSLSEGDIGFLPYPKYDSETNYSPYATEYSTYICSEFSCLAIPKTAKDLEMIGVAVESLSSKSHETVLPAIYDSLCGDDTEEKKVLDTILEKRVFDFGYVYDGWQGFALTVQTMLSKKDVSFQAYYQTKYSNARLQYIKVKKIHEKAQ